VVGGRWSVEWLSGEVVEWGSGWVGEWLVRLRPEGLRRDRVVELLGRWVVEWLSCGVGSCGVVEWGSR
jgi:hypothetical protein